jgi:hypothetical protein
MNWAVEEEEESGHKHAVELEEVRVPLKAE